MSPRALLTVCALAMAAASWPATAEADLLTPEQVLRIDFTQPDVAFPFGAPDTLFFGIGASHVAPIGSYSVSLFDRGTLLGTYSTATNGALVGDLGLPAMFLSATSSYPVPPPFGPAAVIDFSSFADRSIRGTIELSIATGLVDVRLGTINLFLARSNADGTASGSVFTDPIVTGAAISAATPVG